jgi:hypothetical protein
VTAKRVEEGRHVVDITMRGTNQRGDVTCPGSATIALPSRDAGRVFPLPEAPADLSAVARSLTARHLELSAARTATR